MITCILPAAAVAPIRWGIHVDCCIKGYTQHGLDDCLFSIAALKAFCFPLRYYTASDDGWMDGFPYSSGLIRWRENGCVCGSETAHFICSACLLLLCPQGLVSIFSRKRTYVLWVRSGVSLQMLLWHLCLFCIGPPTMPTLTHCDITASLPSIPLNSISFWANQISCL